MKRAQKSRAFLLCLGFLVPSLSLAQEKEILCPVRAIDGKSEREATPLEASREAGTIWSVVRGIHESKLGTQWIEDFHHCVKRSGLPLENFVAERKKFEQKVTVAFQGLKNDVVDANKPKLKGELLTDFEDRVKEVLEIDPKLSTVLDPLVFSDSEKEKIQNEYEAAVSSEKESCTSVDLSRRLGPVRNQTDKGWCYAFAAAELVGYRLGPDTANFTRRVSAADIAIRYNEESTSWFSKFFGSTDPGLKEGGWMGEALKTAIAKGGFCLEKNAPSEEFAFGRLDETIRDIRDILSQPRPSKEEYCFTYLRVQDMFPGVDLDTYSDILSAVGKDNWEYFRQLNEKNCAGKRHTYDIDADSVVDLNQKNSKVDTMLDALDYQLGKKNIASIGFDTKMILPNGDGLHAVTVVGRKYDEKTKSCQYLLRNSWGNGCPSQVKQYLCSKEHSGHLWVSREQLEENTVHLTYIK